MVLQPHLVGPADLQRLPVQRAPAMAELNA
jgi:hypothetical protein